MAQTKIDWLKIASAAGMHGVRYRTNQALLDFIAEVSSLARHRLERSEPVGWMGIESAPRDGSVFFAWCPNVGRVIMNIDGVHRNTWAVDRTYRLGCNPTHWIPLPSAPGTTTPEPVAEIERLREAGQFLLDRLVDHEVRMTSDEDGREWFGHVTPAMARFRALIEGTTHD